jgi:hypothetical protein
MKTFRISYLATASVDIMAEDPSDALRKLFEGAGGYRGRDITIVPTLTDGRAAVAVLELPDEDAA